MAPESDPRYPIGRVQFEHDVTPTKRTELISIIAALPEELTASVGGLDDTRLDTPYRDGGWTVRQLIHHVADSHLNAVLRFRLALTIDQPTIVTYEQDPFANLADARTCPVDVSLTLLKALHERWVVLLESLADADWSRTFIHPEREKPMNLDAQLQLYAWHGRHHTAHVTALRSAKGW